jgi:hypothetical protein
MGHRFGFRLLGAFVVCAAIAGLGFYTYNLGVAQGIVEGGRALAAPGAGAPLVVVWPRPWGFGFFPFFPFLFILFWFFLLRGIFWRGMWHHRRWDYGYGGVPAAFEEWHRRAHAQSSQPPSPDVKA